MPMLRRVVAALAIALIARAPSLLAQSTTAGRASPDSTALGAIVGTLADSARGAPLPHTTVFLGGTPRLTATDAAGRFRFDSVPAGQYAVSFDAPWLDRLGLEAPYAAVRLLPGETDSIHLALPAPSAVVAAICPASARAGGGALLMGAVRDATDGKPRIGAQVLLDWAVVTVVGKRLQTTPQHARATTDSSGAFLLCGVPGGTTISAHAAQGAAQSGTVSVHIPIGGIARRDFMLAVATDTGLTTNPGANAPSGTAFGVVRAENGHPVPGAQIAMAGTKLPPVVSDATGHYRLSGLPAGTQSLYARRVGFLAQTRAVDLRAGVPARVDFTLESGAVVLDSIRVIAQRVSGNIRMEGFERRRREGFGYFTTEKQIRERAPIDVYDILRTVPGIQVEYAEDGSTHVISTRGMPAFASISTNGACSIKFFIDGVPVDDISFVRPREIAGVEVYPAGTVSPIEFGDPTTNCGEVLLWTRTGVDTK